jgi:hypothetical protein
VEIASTVVGYLDLSQLNDVTITSPTSGQALTYNGTGWVNSTPASTVDSLTDTDIDSAASDDALLYNGNSWVNEKVQKAKLETSNSDTISVDFSDTTQLVYREVAGNVNLSGTNYTAGVRKQINFSGDSIERNISYPPEWNFVSEKPTIIPPSRNSVLDLSCYGSTASSAIAIWIPGTFHPLLATGGTITEIEVSGVTYKVHTFSTTGTTDFIVSDIGSNVGVEYLIVGGGAGGAAGFGNGNGTGGGGAGGVLTNISSSTLELSTDTYSVIVGAGGAGGTQNRGTNLGGESGYVGESSSFALMTAVGGGFGGANGAVGGNGGSGGGGGASAAGGSAITGQGNNGGAGESQSGAYRGGGGGGRGSAGATGLVSGNGGTGTSSSISGNSLFYAGGGGGGVYNSNGSVGVGGSSIGGNGGNNTGGGGNGVANTGSGGGGGGSPTSGTSGGPGGNGGSGIVIVRYPITDPN